MKHFVRALERLPAAWESSIDVFVFQRDGMSRLPCDFWSANWNSSSTRLLGGAHYTKNPRKMSGMKFEERPTATSNGG